MVATVQELLCVLCVPCFEVLKMAPRSRQRFCQVKVLFRRLESLGALS